MSESRVSRRQFVQDGAAAAAGLAAAGMVAPGVAAAETPSDAVKTRSYNPQMEYRRLGRTGLMLSAVSLGGHWKKIPHGYGSPEFKANRREVVAACLDHGINYVDACSAHEVLAYAEAVRGRREQIYFGFDFTMARDPSVADSLEALKNGLDRGLKQSGLDYCDLWRITMQEQTSRSNTQRQIELVMEALAWGKKSGKARFTGVSSHDRPWIAEAVAKHPQIEVIITPYTAGTRQKPQGSMFEAVKKHDVGLIGIKPFASGTVFKSRGQPDSSTKTEDDRRARMALRYVLACEVLTAAIPGLVTVDQVANAAKAVTEKRTLDVAEARELEEMAAEMWSNLPEDYKWLRRWEWV